MRSTGSVVAAAWVLTVVAALTACAPERPDDGRIDAPTLRPVPTATATTPPDPSGAPLTLSAYLVLAAVDLDGLTVSASGGVDGLLETGGTCTFTFAPESGAAPVVTTSTSIADARNTSCGTVTVAIESFTAGNWEASLTFTSPRGTAESEPIELEIP